MVVGGVGGVHGQNVSRESVMKSEGGGEAEEIGGWGVGDTQGYAPASDAPVVLCTEDHLSKTALASGVIAARNASMSDLLYSPP